MLPHFLFRESAGVKGQENLRSVFYAPHSALLPGEEEETLDSHPAILQGKSNHDISDYYKFGSAYREAFAGQR